MWHIAVARGSLANLAAVQERHTGSVEFVEIDVDTPLEIARGTAQADAVIVALQSITSKHVEALGTGVRVIGRAGIGLDSIDLNAAAARGISVVNQPDYATDEVATHAVAMLLAVHRMLVCANSAARGDWGAWRAFGRIVPIEEQTVGVVGAGRIGRAVIDRVRPFAGTIVVFDPVVDTAPPGTTLVADFEDFLSRADLLTLHLPLTEQTRRIIDANALKLMPAGAIVVNVSRGGLVDEAALVEAIDSGHVAGAALDVMEHEPLPIDSPLIACHRVLLSPHMAWYSTSSQVRLRDQTVDAVVEYLDGRAITHGNLAVNGRL